METVELVNIVLNDQARVLNGHDLGFFLSDQFVNLADVFVGKFLDVILCATFFVFGNLFVLDHLFETVIGIAANVTHGDLGVLALGANHLGKVAATLFGKGRHRNANIVAHRNRVQTKVGITNRLFDRTNHVLFIRLHAQGACVDHVDVSYLTHRYRRAVILDLHMIENAGMGTARADLGQTGLKCVQAFCHTAFGGLPDLGCAHFFFLYQTWTRVPSSSPSTTRRKAPGLLMENTLIGNFWSRHSANAVASMTSSRRTMTSSKLMRA